MKEHPRMCFFHYNMMDGGRQRARGMEICPRWTLGKWPAGKPGTDILPVDSACDRTTRMANAPADARRGISPLFLLRCTWYNNAHTPPYGAGHAADGYRRQNRRKNPRG